MNEPRTKNHHAKVFWKLFFYDKYKGVHQEENTEMINLQLILSQCVEIRNAAFEDSLDVKVWRKQKGQDVTYWAINAVLVQDKIFKYAT